MESSCHSATSGSAVRRCPPGSPSPALDSRYADWCARRCARPGQPRRQPRSSCMRRSAAKPIISRRNVALEPFSSSARRAILSSVIVEVLGPELCLDNPTLPKITAVAAERCQRPPTPRPGTRPRAPAVAPIVLLDTLAALVADRAPFPALPGKLIQADVEPIFAAAEKSAAGTGMAAKRRRNYAMTSTHPLPNSFRSRNCPGSPA